MSSKTNQPCFIMKKPWSLAIDFYRKIIFIKFQREAGQKGNEIMSQSMMFPYCTPWGVIYFVPFDSLVEFMVISQYQFSSQQLLGNMGNSVSKLGHTYYQHVRQNWYKQYVAGHLAPCEKQLQDLPGAPSNPRNRQVVMFGIWMKRAFFSA